jgi:CHAT domain-containing protein
MIRLHQLATGILLIVTACTTERSPSPRNVSRSDARSADLPTDPKALALLLAVPPESLRAAGEERYGRQSYDSARAILNVEVVRARAAGDSAAEARARMWVGLAAWRLGDYAAARREGETSLTLKRRLGLDAEVSRSFNALGLLAWNEGRHREALADFDSAIAAARRHADAAGVARAAANIPLVKVELGDFDGARRGLKAAFAAGRDIGDERTQGNALNNMAMVEIRVGRLTEALPLLAEARRHYTAIEYATGESNALAQLATAWSGLGDLQRAIATADSALVIARAQGLQQEIAATLEILADLHTQAGSPRLALNRLVEADSIDSALGLQVERGTNLRRASAILLDLGEAPASVSKARAALSAHRAVEAHGEEVYDVLQLAQSLSRSGDARGAQVEADSARQAAARLGNPSVMRDVAAVESRLALNRRDPRSANIALDAVPASESLTDWRLTDLRAEALFALGRLQEAQREEERSIAALERERNSLGWGPLRSGYLASRTAPFSRLVAIHLALADTGAAFQVAASVPGRNLAERLGGFASTPGDLATVVEGERLLLRASALERALSELDVGPQSAERRSTLERALEATQAAYEEQLAHRATSPAAQMLGLTSVTLHDVESQLTSGEALLTFLSGPDRLDLFVVRAKSIQYRSVPIGDRALGERVRVARELLVVGQNPASVAAVLGELNELLLPSATRVAALEGISRLLIVPHGALSALPFASLWDRATGKFLAENYVVSYLPSVAPLTMRRTGRGDATSHMMIFAPLPDSLPGTRREALAVARLIPGAQLRLGPESSKRAVRSALDAGWSIHLASHGAQNSQNPLFSRVIVGQSDKAIGADDGRLEAHEILGLHTKSPLVFLSGCETALPAAGQSPFAEGSEESSLAQAFLAAGARSVVATLWRVNDAGAVEMAESFYRRLRAGLPAEDALAFAQREAIRTKRDFTWAAYTASGLGERKSAVDVRNTKTEP